MFSLVVPGAGGAPDDELWLTVYVDDSLIAGSSESLCNEWMARILERFPGEEVKPKQPPPYKDVDGSGKLVPVEHRDILGADLFYSREHGWTCWSMEGAIGRCLKAHNMDGGQRGKVKTPCQPHADLTQGKPEPNYPIRQVVGSLLYIAVVGRPDALYAASKLARHIANCTTACNRAA